MRPLWLSLATLFVLSAALPRTAAATPKFNPFTYTYNTLGEGEIELEQYADVVPTRGRDQLGNKAWYGSTQFQTEFEYGISDRLELGIYVAYAPSNPSISVAAPTTEATGTKQRLRLRLADQDVWPIDVALYGEVTENDREVELEGKIILQKVIGPVRALINLWGEREYYYAGQKEWVMNPTAALSFQASKSIFPGVEAWMRAEFPDNLTGKRPFNVGPVGYVGPTFSVNFGRFWWTTGAYLKVTDMVRVVQPGDTYGVFWFRNIVGIDL